MDNKAQSSARYRSRRYNNQNHLDFSLTRTQGISQTPLSYSQTAIQPKMINLEKVPHKDEVYPSTSDFDSHALQPRQHSCHRFKAIHNVNKSSPNIKNFSTHKIDIILGNDPQASQEFRNPCIHSVRLMGDKSASGRDLLKQFRQIEEARKELKSRKFLRPKPVSLSVNSIRVSKQINLSKNNPEKGNLYLQVKTRISKRYNNMFKKYADEPKDDIEDRKDFFKGLCNARSIYPRKIKKV